MKELRRRLLRKGLKVACGSEVVRRCPYPVNEAGSDKAQFWIMLSQVLMEMQLEKFEVVLLDRGVLDHLAYAQWLLNHNQFRRETLELLTNLAFYWSRTSPYSLALFFKPLALTEDGFRSVNPLFQQEIHQLLLKIYRQTEKRLGLPVIYVKSLSEGVIDGLAEKVFLTFQQFKDRV